LARPESLEIVFLDPRVYGLGGGNAVFVRTPGGFRCLVDAGPRSVLFQGREIPLDVGSKVVVLAMLAMGTRSLDAVIMSSANAETAGGLVSITGNPSVSVKRFYHALPFNTLSGSEDIDEILLKLNDPVLLEDRRDEGNLTAWILRDIFGNLRKRHIPALPVKSGMILHEETARSGDGTRIPIRIEVLNPPATRFSGKYATSRNTIVLALTFGKTRALLTAGSDKYLLARLDRGTDLRSAVFQVPAGGAGYGFEEHLLDIVRPKIAVLTPPSNRWLRKSVNRSANLIRNRDILLYRTDEDGAVTVRLSEDGCRVQSYASGRKTEVAL
jgi:beta-lactamase superfamily II metal-dependent hydrolase